MGSKEAQDCVHEIANLIREGRVLFFVGSGISREKPTFLPLGDSLRNELVESFCFDQANEIKNRLLGAIKKITLEEVSQIIYEHTGNQLLDVLSNIFDDPKIQPNDIHRFLAKSLTYGNVVVTTNYDSLIERAYIASDTKGKELWLCYDDTHFDEINDYLLNIFSGKEDIRLFSNIFKLHGTFQDIENKRNTKDSVITILSRVGSLSIPKIKVLRKLFGIHHTIFMGYSARDLDIFDALLEVFQDKTIFDEGFASLPRVIQGKKDFFGEIDDYRKEIRKEFEEVFPEFAREATILGTRSDKKLFWIKHSDLKQKQEILTCDDIKDGGVQEKDLETLNTNKLILIKCKYGRNLGIKIKQATIKFVKELAKAERLNWNLAEQNISGKQQSKIESCRKDKLINLARTVPKYTRMLILADIAEKARDWEIAKQFCMETRLTDTTPKSIAETERRLGWYFYQLNRKGDAAMAMHHYERSHSSYQLLGDKFEEARLKSSLGLLYNRRQRELGRKELDTARTYVERAWEILKPILDPMHVTESEITSEEEINQVADKLMELSRYLSVQQKRILAKVWGGIAHVYLRLSGDPGGVIVRKGELEIEKDEEGRQLLYKAITFLKATRRLEKEVGAIRDLIQTDHLIGLTLTRLGKAEEAIKFHEGWTRKAGLLGWEHEYSQACRNLGVAYVYKGDHSKGEKWVEESIKHWEDMQKSTGEDRTTDIEAAKKLKEKISTL